MELKTIKNYAPAARCEFIEAVSDRAALFGITETNLPDISFKGDVALVAGRAVSRIIGQQCNKLCDMIRAAGFQSTMEQVAYTWFNRLVAIRYMELHDYLDHGYRVLSSRAEDNDLPEILRYAEQLDLPGLDRSTVVELKLDGSKDSELYRQILLSQCRALHKIMPFLFEPIDDETELLLPENLLHSDSIIRNLVRNSPQEEWQQVEILGWLYQFYISERKDQVMARKSAVPTEDIPAVTQLFTPHWIVRYLVENSLGRLWLLNHPGSKLRDHMPYYIEGEAETDFLKITKPEEIRLCDPASGSGHMLTYAFDLLTLIYEEEGYAPTEIPALILRHNLHGLEICPRAAQLAELALVFKAREKSRRFFQPEHLVRPRIIELQNITFAEGELPVEWLVAGDQWPEGKVPANADILHDLHLFSDVKNFGSLLQPKLSEQQISFLKQRVSSHWPLATSNLFSHNVREHVLRVLEQAEALTQRYHIVVANPPYMGSANFNPSLKRFAKAHYLAAKKNLFSMFINRNQALLQPLGLNAMITLQDWMFISSFDVFRANLFQNATAVSMLHLGPRAFDSISGEIVQAAAFVLMQNGNPNDKGLFYDLVEGRNERDKEKMFLERRNEFFVSASDILSVTGAPVAYWISERVREIFRSIGLLGDVVAIRAGMATGDNEKFVRLWTEVSHGRLATGVQSKEALWSGDLLKWIPFNKGGEFRKWFGNNLHVISYDRASYGLLKKSGNQCPSEEFYFRQNLTWSDVTSASFGVRLTPQGSVFSSVGNSIFGNEEKLFIVGCFLCSTIADSFLRILNPTLHCNPGEVGALPFELSRVPTDQLRNWFTTACQISRADWDNFETSWDFRDQPLLRNYEVGIMNDEGGQETFVIKGRTLAESWENWSRYCTTAIRRMQELETENNRLFIAAYGLDGELQPEVPEAQITLARAEARRDMAAFLSYAVGCMMGRYSLDASGLILANAGDTLEHFRLKIEECGLRMEELSFTPDEDGILPLTELPWFDDDVTERVIEFLIKTFGTETLEANLTFLADNLSPKKNESSRETIRRYLCDNFFTDHTQTYKKRPIYWLFSSGKLKAFQCLVYLHRYHEGTLARMRTEYVVPLLGRIPRRIEDLNQEIERAGSTAAQSRLRKEKDRLGKQLDELRKFDEQLRHAADQRITIDLDDGVKVNYGKFGDLLADVKKIAGEKDE